MINSQKSIAKFVVTLCFLGKVRIAPGTFGSIIAFPLHYIIMHLILRNQIIFSVNGFTVEEQKIITLFILELLFTAIIFCIGIYYISIYINDTQLEDPREIIIDELVGQMLAIILVYISMIKDSDRISELCVNIKIIHPIIFSVLPFVLFRLLDIIKPWPINWFDKSIKSALGVMIDDICAALITVFFHNILVSFMLYYFFRC